MRCERRHFKVLAASTFATLAVVATPGAASAFNPQPDPPARASLVGRVTNACTGAPVGGVDVHLIADPADPTSGDRVPTADRLTNNGGHYLFQGLAAGDYQLQVRGLPAVQRSFVVTVSGDGAVTHFNISLVAPGPC